MPTTFCRNVNGFCDGQCARVNSAKCDNKVPERERPVGTFLKLMTHPGTDCQLGTFGFQLILCHAEYIFRNVEKKSFQPKYVF